VAPVLRTFAGADVRLESDMDASKPYGACLAIGAPPQTYDWEVRERLDAWIAGRLPSALGLAVGERERYRGVAFTFADNPLTEALPSARHGEVALIAGETRRLA
jgi:hypothetical protein